MAIILTLSLVVLSIGARAADTTLLVKHLESVSAAEPCIYGLKDSDGRRMDCLKVFQVADDAQAGVYYGVYHYRSNGVLAVHLARATDLRSWQHLTSLDEHGSQATIWPCENGGYLLAYEKDAPNSCWIRLRYYEDLSALSAGKHARECDITRTLAPTAEGTPSFESVKLGENGVDTSEIKLRFHYYKHADVDQLARGTLTDFKSWKSEASDGLNAALIAQGWLGNLGDRDRFDWQGERYYLQEIQRKKGDWSSWRLGLCDGRGMIIRPLSLRTHAGSTAMANPNVTWVTDAKLQKKLVVTAFLFSEGNPLPEVGTLLYVIDPSKSPVVLGREAPSAP